MKLSTLSGVTALFLLMTQVHCARADSACHYVEQASLVLSRPDQARMPTVEGAVNGQPIRLLLDTGASTTSLTRAEADRQNLNPERINKQMQGIGGLTSVFLVKVKDFAIGDAHATNLRFPVVEALENTGASGMVGVDFLMQYDVELDFAGNRVKLFRADHCDEKALAYWDPHAMSVPMELMAENPRPRIQVKVNGVPFWALVDSGATRTVIDIDSARALGFSPDAPGAGSSGEAVGIGPEKRHVWNMTLDSFAIGDEVIEHPRIGVMDGSDTTYGRKQHEVVLGRDFLQAHHVLLARSQMLFYYTYNGGQVFPTHERRAAAP